MAEWQSGKDRLVGKTGFSVMYAVSDRLATAQVVVKKSFLDECPVDGRLDNRCWRSASFG